METEWGVGGTAAVLGGASSNEGQVYGGLEM